MNRIHFANVLLICVLGTLLLWPNIREPLVHRSINTAYESVCMITSDTIPFYASGVLLESGYILTAAHVIDRNMNGSIDDDEKYVNIKFPSLLGEEFVAEAIAVSKTPKRLDIAVLDPDFIPLPGVKLMNDEEYWSTKVGSPLYIIGMQNGRFPGNITDGRIIEMKKYTSVHRNSANSYFGNSGGGVFMDDKLIGIASAVGIGRQQQLRVPVFSDGQVIGFLTVPYSIPMANSSLHVPVPSVRSFLTGNDLKDVLYEMPIKCPYAAYFNVAIFNIALAAWLFLVFKLMRLWMNN